MRRSEARQRVRREIQVPGITFSESTLDRVIEALGVVLEPDAPPPIPLPESVTSTFRWYESSLQRSHADIEGGLDGCAYKLSVQYKDAHSAALLDGLVAAYNRVQAFAGLADQVRERNGVMAQAAENYRSVVESSSSKWRTGDPPKDTSTSTERARHYLVKSPKFIGTYNIGILRWNDSLRRWDTVDLREFDGTVVAWQPLPE